MFFKKNKRKIDSKIRFQNSRFQQSLKDARNYKRIQRAVPKTPAGVFLAKLGLDSWMARIISLVVLGVLFYLVYVPNFIFIKNIEISNNDGTQALNTISSFFDQRSAWPNKNLILLSKSKLKNYLLSNNRKILSVDKITKKFPNTLQVEISPRREEFVVESSDRYYIISNDGLVTDRFAVSTSSLPSALLLIKLQAREDFGVGQQVLTVDKIEFLRTLKDRLPAIAKGGIIQHEIKDLQSLDFTVYLNSGLKIYFDFNSEVNPTLDRLKILINQLDGQKLKQLAYVDMRFVNRAYICEKNTPCVNDLSLSKTTSTSEQLTPQP